MANQVIVPPRSLGDFSFVDSGLQYNRVRNIGRARTEDHELASGRETQEARGVRVPTTILSGEIDVARESGALIALISELAPLVGEIVTHVPAAPYQQLPPIRVNVVAVPITWDYVGSQGQSPLVSWECHLSFFSPVED